MPIDQTQNPVINLYLNTLRMNEQFCFLRDHDEAELSRKKDLHSEGPYDSPEGDHELNELFLHASQPEDQLKLGHIAHLRARAFRTANFDLW